MTVNDPDSSPLIGFVGPCASGKSTITKALEARGYRTRHIAQEHSYVKDMWQRLTNPDILIFLQASYPTTLARRNLNWKEKDYEEQQRRLSHARKHADLYIETDDLSVEETLQQILAFVEAQKSS
ncbi:MAG: hypothetical protein Kow002_03130 [Anaerolineales bacterium]